MIVVPEVSDQTLDSIFERPGRNDSCHCGSGKKYKRCCEIPDQMAWRAVIWKIREAQVVSQFLATLKSNYPEYDLQDERTER